MTILRTDEPLAITTIDTIHRGDVEALRRLLAEHPALATSRLGDPTCGESRTLLHIATDWPGHFANGPAIVAAVVEAGADVNARFTGRHTETPLHWAASSDDVAVLDALLDLGADIEAPGAVIGGGTPLADAVTFGQWNAARRLIERGARTTLPQAAALGLLDRVEAFFAGGARPLQAEIDKSLWYACHGGQRGTAEYLLAHGADQDWIPPWEKMMPLDAARRSDADELVHWLQSRGARSAKESAP